MSADPLEVALAAQRPLEVEQLVPAHVRRVTVSDHERFRETFDNPHKDDADIESLIDEIRSAKGGWP